MNRRQTRALAKRLTGRWPGMAQTEGLGQAHAEIEAVTHELAHGAVFGFKLLPDDDQGPLLTELVAERFDDYESDRASDLSELRACHVQRLALRRMGVVLRFDLVLRNLMTKNVWSMRAIYRQMKALRTSDVEHLVDKVVAACR